jgi:hypothetical protein
MARKEADIKWLLTTGKSGYVDWMCSIFLIMFCLRMDSAFVGVSPLTSLFRIYHNCNAYFQFIDSNFIPQWTVRIIPEVFTS